MAKTEEIYYVTVIDSDRNKVLEESYKAEKVGRKTYTAKQVATTRAKALALQLEEGQSVIVDDKPYVKPEPQPEEDGDNA